MHLFLSRCTKLIPFIVHISVILKLSVVKIFYNVFDYRIDNSILYIIRFLKFRSHSGNFRFLSYCILRYAIIELIKNRMKFIKFVPKEISCALDNDFYIL